MTVGCVITQPTVITSNFFRKELAFHMQRAIIRALEDKCIQSSPPGCTTMCPVHVDVKKLNEHISNNDFNAAAGLFQKNIPFPRIISRICDHPCQQYCKRREVGGSILISMLEKACIDFGVLSEKTIKPFIKSGKKAAVVGSGLSGLTVAFQLYQKGHEVHIYEKESKIGGRILSFSSEELPGDLVEKDFALVKNTAIQIHTGVEAGKDISFEEIFSIYDVVYIGTGDMSSTGLMTSNGENDIGCTVADGWDPGSFKTSIQGVFAGGTMMRNIKSPGTRYSPIMSISDGKRAAISMDRYLKKVSLTEGRENEAQYSSDLYTSLSGISHVEPVDPKDASEGFNRQEATKEAGRCIKCECMECVKACNFLKKYEGYPKIYIREIANAVNQIYGVRKHKMMVNSCTSCGLCEEVCPNRLDMGDVCHDAKTEMVDKELMPPAIHDFPVNDMLFSNSESFAMFRYQPGRTDGKYAFYPGCQLSALKPGHVATAYRELTEKLEDGVGLFLGCCGAPAQWSGRSSLFEEALDGFYKIWAGNGKPVIIYACTTCHQMLKSRFPEIEFISIWELYDSRGFEINRSDCRKTIALHDPCTSRYQPQVHESVRNIIRKLGYEIEELKFGKDITKCCGYGGLVSFANRPLANEMVRSRLRESDRDFVAYCAICQDHFVSEGRTAMHLFDLLYEKQAQKRNKTADNAKDNSGCDIRLSFSQRHENRIKLKNKFLKEEWKEDMVDGENESGRLELVIPDDVMRRMDDRLILASDIHRVIEYAEQSGCKVFNPRTGRYTAGLKPGIITYWVEYGIENDRYIIYNAYSHRLEINE